MALPNIFSKETIATIEQRVDKLSAQSAPLWGKMNVAQMLAHCNVTYEMAYEPEKHKAPGAFGKLMLKLFVKNIVVSEKPYSKDSRTAPQFIIADERSFEAEKKRLLTYLHQTQVLGQAHFEGRESFSFGKLTSAEYNNMFYKHIDHHLQQFGV